MIDFETLSGSELVAAYNAMTGGSVSRFSSRSVGLRRCREALAAGEVVAAEPEEPIVVAAEPEEPIVVAAEPAKVASPVDALLDVFRSLPDGADIVALGSALGVDDRRIRKLIDHAKARKNPAKIVLCGKRMWKLIEA